MMSATYQLGYRLAIICAGAGALYIAAWDLGGWRIAYMAMAMLMAIGVGASLLAPVGERESAGAESEKRELRDSPPLRQAMIEPVRDLFLRIGPRLWLILALVSLYRLPDFVAGVMAGPLYIDLGFSKPDIANVSKLYGVWIGILGAFAGGIAISRIGLLPCLLFGAAAGAASNLMFSWLALAGPKLDLLILAISVDNFCGSFAGTALIAYMSGLTGPGFAATQYALLSSLYALPGKFVGGVSGYMVEAFGYPIFFALTAAVGIPVVLLCLIIGRLSGNQAAMSSEAEAR
jgi:PAT family beta-lactamase induction signal transducer AmpG